MKKILIIDDSAFMRNILKDLLANTSEAIRLKEPVELFEADGKVNALMMLNTIKPDLVLLDIVMKESEREGVEFLEETKTFYDPHKVIVISSIGQLTILTECVDLGVKNFIQKPFEHNQVIEIVNKVIFNN